MGIGNLPLLSALGDKMRWHQVRQGVLSENVANAETPGYRGRDLKEFAFDGQVRGEQFARLRAEATRAAHFTTLASRSGEIGIEAQYGFETTPEGNSVGLEGEMMKVAGNQMDFMAATTLYTRSMRILKTAIGRSA